LLLLSICRQSGSSRPNNGRRDRAVHRRRLLWRMPAQNLLLRLLTMRLLLCLPLLLLQHLLLLVGGGPLLLQEVIQVIVRLLPVILAHGGSQPGLHAGGEGFELRVPGFVLFITLLNLGLRGGVHFGVPLFKVLHQHPGKHQKAFLLLLLLIRQLHAVRPARRSLLRHHDVGRIAP